MMYTRPSMTSGRDRPPKGCLPDQVALRPAAGSKPSGRSCLRDWPGLLRPAPVDPVAGLGGGQGEAARRRQQACGRARTGCGHRDSSREGVRAAVASFVLRLDVPNDAARLHLEPRQRARRHGRHLHPEQQLVADGPGRRPRRAAPPSAAVGRLDLDPQVGERAGLVHLRRGTRPLREPPDDGLDGRSGTGCCRGRGSCRRPGPGCRPPAAATCRPRGVRLGRRPGPGRRCGSGSAGCRPAEVRHHQFAELARPAPARRVAGRAPRRGNRLPARTVPRRVGRLDRDRADFGHAVVVEDAGPPGLPRCGRAWPGCCRPARRPRPPPAPATPARSIPSCAASFGQVQGVGRRGEDDRRLVVEQEAEPGGAGHAAAGQAQVARPGVAASNAVQKPRNGPNENGKNSRSPGAEPHAGENSICQQPSSPSQLSGVSSQRSGRPVLVPEVWCRRQ